MDVQRVKDYWIEEAEDALRVARHLFEKRDYSYALFFGHLAVEKIVKAVYVTRKGEHSPYIPKIAFDFWGNLQVACQTRQRTVFAASRMFTDTVSRKNCPITKYGRQIAGL